MSFKSLCWSKFSLYRNILNAGVDSTGGFTRTVSLYVADIPCHMTFINGDKRIAYGKENIVSTHKLYVEANYDYRTTDLVKYQGDWYAIQYINNPAQMYHHLSIFLNRTKAPDVFYPESSSSESSWGYSSSSSSSTSMSSSSSSSSTSMSSGSSSSESEGT